MNILVTGTSKGLGLEITRRLLESGNTVFGISRNKTGELEELLSKHKNFNWLQYDLADSSNIKTKVFNDFIKSNPLHAFINNAAVAYDDLITNLNDEPLLSMYRVNVFTPMHIVKYCIRNMLLHNTKGSIIHISSISVHTGYKGLAMYASTKGALEAFSKNTAREWGEKGIRSNCLVVGFMETDMSSTLTPEQKNRIFQRTSLKKPVNTRSVAETVNFLISEKSESITGQNIFIDNGTI